MKFSYNWLQDYFEKELPKPLDLAEVLNLKAFQVESIEGDSKNPIINADILPNRSHDLLSYLGLAKEVAVLLNQNLKLPNVSYQTDPKQKTSDFITLEIENPKLVPRAMKRVVLGVKVGESPDWLRERLNSIGQRSINNIVDITNFVMWETGQPVHTFDLDKIKDGKIKIRGAKEGEKIKVLDGQEFELKEGMLVISDEERALDIAGTKGGFNSGIDQNTKRIVLSVCSFDQTSIRTTSKILGLRTDASVRFENGISPSLVEVAMNRLSQLVSELSGGIVLDEILDNYPKNLVRTSAPYKIGLSLKDINKVLGSDIKSTEVEDILDRFSKHANFGWRKINPKEEILKDIEKYIGVPYKYGASITYDAPNYFDCSSFINYLFVNAGISLPRRTIDQLIYGFEVKESELQPLDLVFSLTPESETNIERLNISQKSIYHTSVDFMKGTEVLSGVSHNGLYLGGGKIIHASGKWHKGEVVIENLKETPAFKNIVGFRRIFLDDDERYLVEIPPERLDLRAGSGYLVSGIKEDLIEEIGRVYGYSNIKSVIPSSQKPKVNKIFYHIEKIKDILVNEGFSEVITYSFQDEGEVKLENPLASDKKYLRKSLYKGLSKALDLNKNNLPLFGVSSIKIFETGKVFSQNKEILSIGLATTDKKYSFDDVKQKISLIIPDFKSEIKDKILLIEVDEEGLKEIDSYDDLLKNLSQTKKFEPISQYPFVLRDIALWTSKEVSDSEVLKNIKEEGTLLLIKSKLFDTYIKDDKVSYAFNLVFQSKEKTLSDEEVNSIMDKIQTRLNTNGWNVR